MITENTHSENNDWQGPGGEHLSVSENSTPSPNVDAPSKVDTTPKEEEPTPPAEEISVAAVAEGEKPVSDEKQDARHEEAFFPQTSHEQGAWLDLPEALSTESALFINAPGAVVHNFVAATPSEVEQPGLPGSDSSQLFIVEGEPPLLPDEAVRPFTDFIAEFRQTEERLSALLNEQDTTFPTFVEGNENMHEFAVFSNAENLARIVDSLPTSRGDLEQLEQAAEVSRETESAPAQPKLPIERPVSPLLRPATRMRLPRHGRHRIEEAVQPEPLPVQSTEAASGAELQVEEQPARPARRYRFDRPAATASASLPTARIHAPSPPTRGADIKEKRGAAFTTQTDGGMSVEPAAAQSGANEVTPPETPAQETTSTSAETGTPTTSPPDRRRRSNHDRQREKEQVATAAPAPSTPEPTTPEVVSAPVPVSEVAIEDLPPLEYSELQAANSRRRRRRRVGSASVPATNGAVPPKAALPDPAAPSSAVALPKNAPVPQSQAYNIVSGYTVSQMNQGNDVTGPFMGPEPSPARGSTFSSSPSLRHARNEALRGTPSHPVKHSESPLMSPSSMNYLANVVGQAIQTQTDRMVAELRRSNQVPTNVSVSLPPFPSTERVGVFVDVANLLYSARTLRMTVDFGKLLDFLRGNRRLVRAQAYCPTSPQPGDDQMFLQAVKGLGYRITTKNYKTFSSGAKKADLDLDLCMDVVRLVDGRAVDCIVLVSGDGDFIPMLDYCSDHGVRVEVAAFDESLSAILRQSCDLFVNLSMLEEIRA